METNEKRPTIIVTRTSNGLLFDVDGIGKMILDVERLNDDLKARGMFHGFEQKVRDAAAIAYKQKDGSFKRPTARQKYDAMAEVIQTLYDGNWNKAREAGADTGLLLEALVRMYPKREPGDIQKWLSGKDDKTKANLRRQPKVAEMIATIRAERNPDAVAVADEVLDELLD